MTLKEQAINGVLWNSTGKFFGMGIEFIVGIILARLLTPKEFGLIGTIMVVIAISQVLINSGFSQALVRKQNCTQRDYSTVFFFNMAVGFFLFAVLLISSGYISKFYENTDLKPLIQVLGIGLIISSLTLIQSTTLIKRIDFKLQTKISVAASIISGVVAVLMALKGFGVWSLVMKSLLNQAVNSALLWYWNRWKPEMVFCLSSFKELFGFGSKLLLSGLIGTFFNNIYYIIIGKYFSAVDLGFYTRAELFKNLPSQNISDIVTSVGYPVLSKVQDNPNQLKAGLIQIITLTFFIVSILMFGMAAVADSLILTLVGEQWKESVIYLQMLCFIGLMYPLNSININLLNVVGRSDLYLKLQIISQLLAIPVIILGVFLGIKLMIMGMCLNSIIAFFFFSRISSKYSGYKAKTQIKEISPSFFLTMAMGIIVYLVDFLTNFSPIITLIYQLFSGGIILYFLCELFKLEEYLFLKKVIILEFKKVVQNLKFMSNSMV